MSKGIEFLKKNMAIVSLVFLGLLLVIVGVYFSQRKNSFNSDEFMKSRNLKNCETQISRVIVEPKGNDVYPMGTELEVEMNYYNCNIGKKDEVAMIVSPGRDQPIFKYIKMAPGDKFKVVKNKSGKFNVEVNGQTMADLENKPYEFLERKAKMIQLYESNFKDGVKEGVYFVFGSSLVGGFDSTRFGPVTNERLVGRVIKVTRAVEKK